MKFVDYLKLTNSNIDERKGLCTELNSLFEKFFPRSCLSIFGSTANELGCKGSDMDVTLLFDDYLKSLNHNKKPVSQGSTTTIAKQNGSDSSVSDSSSKIDDLDLDDDVDEDMTTQAADEEAMSAHEQNAYYTEGMFDEKIRTFALLDVEEQVNVIVRILQRYAHDIQDVRKITSARCPIIKFRFDKANMVCDLTLNNFLVIENTNLIKVYLGLNSHLERLIFVIRFWFKQKTLHGSLKFNSYTIIWLIVFYMQSIGLLPAVNVLADMARKKNKTKYLFGWDCTYEADVGFVRNELSPTTSTTTTPGFADLLRGFFDFYSTFLFNERTVLSTRTGKLDEIGERELSRVNCINMQDPFDLSHNLSGNISKRTLDMFKAECSQTSVLLGHCVGHKSASKCWGLSMLFTRKTPEFVQKTTNAHQSLIELKASDENAKAEMAFIVHVLKDCLQFEISNCVTKTEDKEAKKRKVPMLQICNQVDSLGLNGSPKRIRTSDNPEKFVYAAQLDECNKDLSADNDDQMDPDDAYTVHVNKNTWQGRRNVRRELAKIHDESLDLERAISNKLIELNNNNSEKASEFNFHLCFFTSPDPNGKQPSEFTLKIQFDLIDDCKEPDFLMNFDVLVHFLNVYLNNCFQKYFSAFKAKVNRN
jgi:DNA polymerase sigma